MEEEKHINNTLFWEVPEVDLNLRHYSGSPSDVIKKLKSSIALFLSNPNLKEERSSTYYSKNGASHSVTYNVRQIYSAIYNALNYYKDISYLPAAEFGTGDTFLSSSIRTFNEDYAYLSSKYNSDDPTKPPVINFCGRIKSPLSAVEKIREKVSEYILENRDFKYFNESLRDFVGVRVIVNPPEEIQKQGLQAEHDFMCSVFYDLMKKRGITLKPQDVTPNGLLKFIPVNTRHDPNKIKKYKSRPQTEGFSDDVTPGVNGFYIPKTRIPEMDQECVDSVVKDYIMYPKFRGYQSLHTCVVPYYSQNVDRIPIPSYIIPSSCEDYSFEYQFRTEKQNQFAEYGPASHSFEYKPVKSYHRLAVPFYIDFDYPYYISEDLYDSSNSPTPNINHRNILRLRNFAESFRKFYGYSFESYFGISFKKFRDTFGSEERNDILAGKLKIFYDKENGLYTASPMLTQRPVALAGDDLSKLRMLLKSSTQEELIAFFEETALNDSYIRITPSNIDTKYLNTSQTSNNFFSGVQLYSLELSDDRILETPIHLKHTQDYPTISSFNQLHYSESFDLDEY